MLVLLKKAGVTFGLTVGPLAAKVLVPDQFDMAKKIIAEMEHGDLFQMRRYPRGVLNQNPSVFESHPDIEQSASWLFFRLSISDGNLIDGCYR